jgi:F420-non-reducing hydrogenase large subunit
MAHTVVVDPVTRIEGHAKILLDLDDGGQVKAAHLEVLEMRGFEKLLQGMELFKMPLITARICGVCPVAHHLVSVIAIENGLQVEIPQQAKLLRELLKLGSIVHSHALSLFVLSGPDLMLGVGAPPLERNVFNLLRINPELAKKMLHVRSIGQRIVEIVGGRGIHPVACVPGGMSARPSTQELANIADWGRQTAGIAAELAGALGEKLRAFDDFRGNVNLPQHAMALSRNGALSFLDGDCVVSDPAGTVVTSFQPSEYAEHMIEHVAQGSYMKTVRLRGDPEQSYFVGPLARLNVNTTIPAPHAQAMLDAFHAKSRFHSAAFDFVEARMIELMFAAERIAAIAGDELSGGPIRVECVPKAGRFVGAVEAPRGILIHDYTADADGRIVTANLIVATQNNYDAINHSLMQAGKFFLPQNDENLLFNGLEFALRCFDPCLSCATHIAGRMPMKVIVRQSGAVTRTIARRQER